MTTRRVTASLFMLVLAPTLSISAHAAPATTAAPATIEGTWLGSLKVGEVSLRIAFHLTRAPDGKLAATFDSLDQGARGIPFDTSTYAAPKLALGVSKLAAGFDGKLDGDTLSGSWTQSGHALPLTLRRVARIEEPKRPQEPKRPFSYREVEVTIPVLAAPLDPKQAGGYINLAGTMSLPPGKGPFPAVLFITGSGAQDRDETVFDHKPFLVISDSLVRRGIATLRLDDRGVGKSGGSPIGATTLDFAEDIKTAVAWLAARPEIDKRTVGLVGHSEGGLIAPIVASTSDVPRFLVLLAGTGMSGADVLRIQIPALLHAAGKSDADVARAKRDNERIFPILLRETDPVRAEAAIRAALADDPQSLKELPPIDTMMNPWMRTFLKLDPTPYLQKVRVPVLALNGERDLQVDVRNLALIEAALKKGGDKDVTVVRLPGLNHLFQHTKTGAGGEYSLLEETFAPEALQLVGDWIAKRGR